MHFCSSVSSSSESFGFSKRFLICGRVTVSPLRPVEMRPQCTIHLICFWINSYYGWCKRCKFWFVMRPVSLSAIICRGVLLLSAASDDRKSTVKWGFHWFCGWLKFAIIALFFHKFGQCWRCFGHELCFISFQHSLHFARIVEWHIDRGRRFYKYSERLYHIWCLFNWSGWCLLLLYQPDLLG